MLSDSRYSHPAIKVLFVCYANVCRSPMAEAIMSDMVKKAGLSHHILVDSAGTTVPRIGVSPVEGTLRVLEQHGITYDGVSRQMEFDDLNTFNYILAMDRRNMTFLNHYRRGTRADVRLLLDFAAERGLTRLTEIEDPFPNGDYDFTYKTIQVGCSAFMDHLRQHLKYTIG